MEITTTKQEEEFKDFKPTYHERKLDICGICQKKYNVTELSEMKKRAPVSRHAFLQSSFFFRQCLKVIV